MEYEREEEFGTVAGGLEHKGRTAGGVVQVESPRDSNPRPGRQWWTGGNGINETGRTRHNLGDENDHNALINSLSFVPLFDIRLF